MDILAQATQVAQETSRIPWTDIICGLVVAVGGGGAGGAALTRHMGRRRRTRERAEDRAEVCPVHEEFATLLKERKENTDEAIKAVANNVAELKEDVKEGFKAMSTKIDAMGSRGRVNT